MDLLKVGFLVLFSIIMISYFKQENTTWAFLLKLAIGVFIGFMILEKFVLFHQEYGTIAQELQKYSVYIKLFLKALGISYICEFVSNVAREEGHLNLSMQVELLGKLSVFSLGIPVLITLFEYLEHFF